MSRAFKFDLAHPLPALWAYKPGKERDDVRRLTVVLLTTTMQGALPAPDRQQHKLETR